MNFLKKIQAFNTQLEAQILGGRHVIRHGGRGPDTTCDGNFETRIIIIDRSGSMYCTDYLPSRLHAAKNAAVEYVTALVNRSQAASAKHYPANSASYKHGKDLGSLWDDFFELLPLPKPLAVSLIAAVFFIVFFMMRTFMKGF